MPIEKIELHVSRGSGVRHQVRVLEKRLGDGYTQRSADGLNNMALKYEAVWTGLTLREAAGLVQFFQDRAGVEPFLVAKLPEPLDTKKWVCKDWSEEWVSAQRRNVRAMFEEDFSL
ncbi:MAG: phage tail protein [Acidobacteria bacterium]|nr:phage tail protein [Acidobacteriota bacterium]MCY3971106.1 phage tail protein [Acidobacteriota bacterium]